MMKKMDECLIILSKRGRAVVIIVVSRHQRTQCVNTTKSGTLCSQGTAP